MRQIRRGRGQAMIASLLVGLVLLLDAMAASPALHELIHSDAGEPDHQCAVTLFSHGHVDSVAVEVPLPLALSFVEIVPVFDISVYRPVIGHLPAGRGPPVASVVS